MGRVWEWLSVRQHLGRDKADDTPRGDGEMTHSRTHYTEPRSIWAGLVPSVLVFCAILYGLVHFVIWADANVLEVLRKAAQ